MKKNTLFLALIIATISMISCEQEPCTETVANGIEIPCQNNNPFPFNNF